MVDTEEVKHDAQTEQQHPLYSPLVEQWENAVAAIQNLQPRVAFVKPRGAKATQIRTERVQPYRVQLNEVDALESQLARIHSVTTSNLNKTLYESNSMNARVQFVDWENMPQRLDKTLADDSRLG